MPGRHKLPVLPREFFEEWSIENMGQDWLEFEAWFRDWGDSHSERPMFADWHWHFRREAWENRFLDMPSNGDQNAASASRSWQNHRLWKRKSAKVNAARFTELSTMERATGSPVAAGE